MLAAVALFGLAAAGCRTEAWRARDAAARTTDATRPRAERVEAARDLAALGAAADEFLPRVPFPIGIYDVPFHALDEMAAAGFSIVVNADKTSDAYIDLAASLGLGLIPYVQLDDIPGDVKPFADEPAIFGWYLFDEPDLYDREPEWIAERHEELKRADPGRPVYLVVWSPRRYADYAEWCDIFGVAPYPIIEADPAENDLRRVPFAVGAGRRAAEGRPVWAIIQAFWAEPLWARNPTPEELRAMVYLALNHGADGIVYFGYRSGDRPITEHEDLFAMMRRLNGEVAALGGLWLKQPTPVLSSLGEEGGIDIAVRRFRERILLVAVNPDPEPASATGRVPGAQPLSKATPLFAGPGAEPFLLSEEGEVSLELDPFEARVIMIHPTPEE